MFNFIGNRSAGNATPPFDLTNYRKFRVESVLDSDMPEMKPVIARLRRLGESKSKNSNFLHERFILREFVVKRWQFNPLVTDKDIARIIRDMQKYASKSGDTFLIPDANIGEDMPAELAFASVHHAENIDSIERNYKFLLKGVKSLVDVVGRVDSTGMAMKTLYTTWLHMVNDEGVKHFINPFGDRAIGNKYANTMGPNMLVNKYASQNANEEPLQDQLKHALEAYIHANSGDRGVRYRYDTFMRDLLSLFNKSLDCGILTSKEIYNDLDIDEELAEMEKRFPTSKFTEEFIDSTTTIEDWNLFKPEDLENEFGIKEYTIDSVVGESMLEPVGDDVVISLNAEKSSLELAKVFSHVKMGKEAEYYSTIYRKRMTSLKTNEETYMKAKEIEDNINPILPEFLASKKRDAMGFGPRLEREMIDLGSYRKSEVDDLTKRYLNVKLREAVRKASMTFIGMYRSNEWSVTELQETEGIRTIFRDLGTTLSNKGGIITLIGKELDLDLRFDDKTDLDNQFTAMTEDYLIVTMNNFIVPQVKENENQPGQYILTIKDSMPRDR